MSKELEWGPYREWYLGFWIRFEQLCDWYGVTPQIVSNKIHVAPATISQWKTTFTDFCKCHTLSEFEQSKGTMPSVESLIRLSVYFSCSTDYLIGTKNDWKTERIDRVIKKLSAENKEKLLEYAKLLLMKQEHEKVTD